MSKEIKYNRRNFLNNAFIAFGAAELSMLGLDKQFTNQDFARTYMSNP